MKKRTDNFHVFAGGGSSRRDFIRGALGAAAGGLVVLSQIKASPAEEIPKKEEKPSAPGMKPIRLMKPQLDGGRPLMQVLKDRKSQRDFSPEKLPSQVLSNLLWAAWGINRIDGKRTAPSGADYQETDIYVAMAEGLYVFHPKYFTLYPVLAEDIRAMSGTQTYVKDAPLSLIYVSDLAKMVPLLPAIDPTPEEKVIFAHCHAGFISQNVYLFCASEGLATCVRELIDKPPLVKVMKLRAEQIITLAQAVGYPKKQ